MRRGAWVVSRGRPLGKGGNVTAAAQAAIGEFGDEATASSATRTSGRAPGALSALVGGGRGRRLRPGGRAASRIREGGGFGIALGYARRAVEKPLRRPLAAPLSASAPCASRPCGTAPFRGRLGTGDRHDDRRGPRRPPAPGDRATARAPAPPGGRPPGFLHRAASSATSGGPARPGQIASRPDDPGDRPGDHGTHLHRLRRAGAGRAGAATASSSSTSRGRGGSSTTPPRSGR